MYILKVGWLYSTSVHTIPDYAVAVVVVVTRKAYRSTTVQNDTPLLSASFVLDGLLCVTSTSIPLVHGSRAILLFVQ